MNHRPPPVELALALLTECAGLPEAATPAPSVHGDLLFVVERVPRAYGTADLGDAARTPGLASERGG